jgi:cytochrome c oxidase cbb3-type subunit 4
MAVVFVVLVCWPFRPGATSRNEDAATMIFRDDDNGPA